MNGITNGQYVTGPYVVNTCNLRLNYYFRFTYSNYVVWLPCEPSVTYTNGNWLVRPRVARAEHQDEMKWVCPSDGIYYVTLWFQARPSVPDSKLSVWIKGKDSEGTCTVATWGRQLYPVLRSDMSVQEIETSVVMKLKGGERLEFAWKSPDPGMKVFSAQGKPIISGTKISTK
jgi:hypothetical protein